MTITNKLYWKGIRKPQQEETLVLMSTDGKLWANLPLYLDEVNKSPTGFSWGFRGSGPAQLAYAILRTYFEVELEMPPESAKIAALREYYLFKNDIICDKFGTSWEWELNSEQVRDWRIGAGIQKYDLGETTTSGSPIDYKE